MRFRYVYMGVFTLIGLILLFLVQPDVGIIQNLPFGAGLIATLSSVFLVTLYVAILHYSRKGLFDYVDFEELLNKAKEESTGAGLFAIAVAIAMLALAILISAVATV